MEYVYFVTAGPYCKIGMSADLPRRLQSLQPNCPYEVQVCSLIIDGNAKELEQSMDLLPFRIRGEWYKLTPQMARYVAEVYAPSPHHVAHFQVEQNPSMEWPVTVQHYKGVCHGLVDWLSTDSDTLHRFACPWVAGLEKELNDPKAGRCIGWFPRKGTGGKFRHKLDYERQLDLYQNPTNEVAEYANIGALLVDVPMLKHFSKYAAHIDEVAKEMLVSVAKAKVSHLLD